MYPGGLPGVIYLDSWVLVPDAWRRLDTRGPGGKKNQEKGGRVSMKSGQGGPTLHLAKRRWMHLVQAFLAHLSRGRLLLAAGACIREVENGRIRPLNEHSPGPVAEGLFRFVRPSVSLPFLRPVTTESVLLG